MSEPLFDHQNAAYVQLLYEEFSRNPDSVPEAWRSFFSQGPGAIKEAGLLVTETLDQECPDEAPGEGEPGGPSNKPSPPHGGVQPAEAHPDPALGEPS